MSTHKDEIIHLSNTAISKGASVQHHHDQEGRIDTITITGLKGLRDIHKGSLIASMEALRPVVGHDAIKPSLRMEEGSPVYSYSESQLRCYGGIEVLIKQKLYRNELRDNAKFISEERMNDGSKNVKYWSSQEEDLVKFDSKEAFDDFVDAPLFQEEGYSY